MKVIMEGVIDCIMHDHIKKITPTKDSKIGHPPNVGWPKEADVTYSKLWIVLEGSDPENPWWLEVERPMIPQCEWQKENGKEEVKEVASGQRIRVTMEILP